MFLFLINGAGITGYLHQKMNLDADLTPATKNSKWIIFSNVKYQTIKLLDYDMGEYLDNLVYGNDFLSTPKT